MSNRRGFTLIELMVVICLICILSALALPAANRVRQTSAQVSCLSNIRQITAGCMAYAGDNDGKQLPYWWDPGTWSANASTGGWSRLWCSPYSTSGH
jgi:prepilin-type N-terminal cleavage/methylation domain-containing protein